jgi:hypothetical protein
MKLSENLLGLVQEMATPSETSAGADVGLGEKHRNKILIDPKTVKTFTKLFEMFVAEPLGDWSRFAAFLHGADQLFQRFGAQPLPKDEDEKDDKDPTKQKGAPKDTKPPENTVEDESDTEQSSTQTDESVEEARRLGIILFKLGIENDSAAT